MGEIVESLEALRQQIFSFMSKEELHLVTMWLYLSATRQIEPVFEENKCQIRITRSYPDERECLYQLFRQLSCDFYKDILCMYEYIISEQITNAIPPNEVDMRVSPTENVHDVGRTLRN